MIVIIIILCLAGIFLGSVIITGWLLSAPPYKGPLSDHFNGKKFINPGGIKSAGFRELWKWMRKRERGAWTKRMNVPSGPAPLARVEGHEIVVTFINHSSFLIQTMGLNILTDPVWSRRAGPNSFSGPERMRPPGIRFEDLPEINVILLTHNHYDHLDVEAEKRLVNKFEPVIYCPLGVGQYLKKKGINNFIEMDWWHETEFNEHLSILCTPAQHFSGRGTFDRNRTLWSGFALRTVQGSIYYSGDTGYGDFFKAIAEKISPVRLSFLPIGAFKPSWFMSPIHTSPADALKIHREIGSSISIGMHFGTFPLADDGQDDPVNELRKLKLEGGYSEEEFIVLEEGEAWTEMPSQKIT